MKLLLTSTELISWRSTFRNTWNCHFESAFNKRAQSPEKLQLPIISTWQAEQHTHLAFADFDSLPPDFVSFDELAEHLEQVSFGRWIVIRSASCKVKLVIKFQLPTREHFKKPYTERGRLTALKALSEVLPGKLLPYIDTSHGGLSLCFVNSGAIEKISAGLQELEGVQVELQIPPPVVKPKRKFRYAKFTHALPHRIHKWANGDKDKEAFSATVVALWYQLQHGFELCQPSLAEHLGIPLSRVNRYLIEWQVEEFINLNSSSYSPGFQSMSYTLPQWLVEHCKRQEKAHKEVTAFDPSTFVPKGEFNKLAPKVLGRLGIDGFLAWGYVAADTKERKYQVEYLARKAQGGLFQVGKAERVKPIKQPLVKAMFLSPKQESKPEVGRLKPPECIPTTEPPSGATKQPRKWFNRRKQGVSMSKKAVAERMQARLLELTPEDLTLPPVDWLEDDLLLEVGIDRSKFAI